MNSIGVKSFIAAMAFSAAAAICCPAQDSFSDSHVVFSLSMEDGLPCNYIDDIHMDSAGFLWLATSGGGVCRYDGYSFLSFNTASSAHLKSNFVRNIAEDRFHRLWLASEGGIDIIDLTNMELVRMPSPRLEEVCYDFCSYITTDALGNVWFKSGASLFRVSFFVDGSVDKVLEYPSEALRQKVNIVFKDVDGDGTVWLPVEGRLLKVGCSSEGTLSASAIIPSFTYGGAETYVSDIVRTGGEVWVSTENGIYRLQPKTGMWKLYTHDRSNPASLTQNFVTDLALTEDDILIATTLYGINVYEAITDGFERVGSDVINCLRVYGSEVLAGTETDGLKIFSPRKIDVTSHVHNPFDSRSLSKGPVNAIREDFSGRIWVGVQEGGLCLMDRPSAGFEHITRESGGLCHNSVSALSTDPLGRLVVGTWGGGVDFLSDRRPFRVAGHIEDPSGKLDYVGSLEYDGINDLLWIGSNQGVFTYDLTTRELAPALREQVTGCIGSCIDSSGRLWMGCLQGLCVFDLTSHVPGGGFPVVQYKYKLDNPSSHVMDKICYVMEAPDGTIWLGSNGNGVYKAVPQSDGTFSFISFSHSDGLSNDRVKAIAGDSSGRLWISTDYGLNLFDPATWTSTPFFARDGLDGEQFFWNAGYTLRDGRLLFGYTGGLLEVDPSGPADESFDANNMRFTEITVSDRHIYNPFITSLQLHERDRSMTFEFAALVRSPIDKVVYRYRMEGFDNQWQTLPEFRHEAVYSALPRGSYVLRVKAESPSGEEISSLALPVRVKPYFYRTWWFYLFTVILILAGIYFLHLIRKRNSHFLVGRFMIERDTVSFTLIHLCRSVRAGR